MIGKQEVLQRLKEKEINFTCIEHPAVFTMEELHQLSLEKESCVAKNLFLRDDKHRAYYLVTTHLTSKINLKELQSCLHCRPLSFCSQEDTYRYLKLEKGSLTPFGLWNDEENKVIFVLDDCFSSKEIGIHPNDNTATVFMNADDLCSLLKEHSILKVKIV